MSVVESLRRGEREGVDGWWTVMQDAADGIERLEGAIRHYACQQPLDLKSAREIQADLLSIAGDEHYHVRSIGDDRCLICGHDLRHEIHKRIER